VENDLCPEASHEDFSTHRHLSRRRTLPCKLQRQWERIRPPRRWKPGRCFGWSIGHWWLVGLWRNFVGWRLSRLGREQRWNLRCDGRVRRRVAIQRWPDSDGRRDGIGRLPCGGWRYPHGREHRYRWIRRTWRRRWRWRNPGRWWQRGPKCRRQLWQRRSSRFRLRWCGTRLRPRHLDHTRTGCLQQEHSSQR